ncbi:MAG: hypothetical protein NT069_23565 [Planctomycetota bacterium]|nr:hypothetical protein [Planctomycetota bacterium]
MKNFDEIREVAATLDDGGKAMEREESQDELEHEMGIIAKGALDWATDQSTPMAKRFEALVSRYAKSLKRLSQNPTDSKPAKRRKAAAPF